MHVQVHISEEVMYHLLPLPRPHGGLRRLQHFQGEVFIHPRLGLGWHGLISLIAVVSYSTVAEEPFRPSS